MGKHDDIFNRKKSMDRYRFRQEIQLKIMMLGVIAMILISAYSMIQPPTPEEITKTKLYNDALSGEDCNLTKNWLVENIHMNSKSEGGLAGSPNISWNKYQKVNQIYDLECR